MCFTLPPFAESMYELLRDIARHRVGLAPLFVCSFEAENRGPLDFHSPMAAHYSCAQLQSKVVFLMLFNK